MNDKPASNELYSPVGSAISSPGLWVSSVGAELSLPLPPEAQATLEPLDQSLHGLDIGVLEGPPQLLGAARSQPPHVFEHLALEVQELPVEADLAGNFVW